MHICSICQGEFNDDGFGMGHGNNARPVNDGRCCDQCNAMVVIPARFMLFSRESKIRPVVVPLPTKPRKK